MDTVTSIAATVLPLWQQRRQHDEALRLSNELHRKTIELSSKYHNEEMELDEELFNRDCALERELHYGQMSHDFDIARREGVRDAWSQRSQLLQTLMVVDTLMFSCAYAVLIQADPPQETPVWLLRCYAFALGSALSLLFASVWCSMKLQGRLSQYDMHRQDVVYVCRKTHRYFNDYYSCHCKQLSSGAFHCFYAGTCATLAAAALFAFAKMYYAFTNVAGGIVFVCFSALSISLPFLTNVLNSMRKLTDGDEEEEEMDIAHDLAVQEAGRNVSNDEADDESS